jgi:hypothetical protein
MQAAAQPEPAKMRPYTFAGVPDSRVHRYQNVYNLLFNIDSRVHRYQHVRQTPGFIAISIVLHSSCWCARLPGTYVWPRSAGRLKNTID